MEINQHFCSRRHDKRLPNISVWFDDMKESVWYNNINEAEGSGIFSQFSLGSFVFVFNESHDVTYLVMNI